MIGDRWPEGGGSIGLTPMTDGLKYANEVAHILSSLALPCDVSIIDAMALASTTADGGNREPVEGWDAANALAEWPDIVCASERGAGPRKAIRGRPRRGRGSEAGPRRNGHRAPYRRIERAQRDQIRGRAHSPPRGNSTFPSVYSTNSSKVNVRRTTSGRAARFRSRSSSPGRSP